jgi:hypothetical protein
MTRQHVEAKDDEATEDGSFGRFQTLAKALVAVPKAEVQAALDAEKRAKAERKRAKP